MSIDDDVVELKPMAVTSMTSMFLGVIMTTVPSQQLPRDFVP
jgi:hypothetical protein